MVNVIPISGALANWPLDLASESFFSVGGSVLNFYLHLPLVSKLTILYDVKHDGYRTPAVIDNIR